MQDGPSCSVAKKQQRYRAILPWNAVRQNQAIWAHGRPPGDHVLDASAHVSTPRRGSATLLELTAVAVCLLPLLPDAIADDRRSGVSPSAMSHVAGSRMAAQLSNVPHCVACWACAGTTPGLSAIGSQSGTMRCGEAVADCWIGGPDDVVDAV